jgi:hypothetical protein
MVLTGVPVVLRGFTVKVTEPLGVTGDRPTFTFTVAVSCTDPPEGAGFALLVKVVVVVRRLAAELGAVSALRPAATRAVKESVHASRR